MYLFDHPRVSYWLGIKYEDEKTWKTNRVETRLHVSGLFTKLFQIFTGMSLVVSEETRKELLRLQSRAKEISMEHYFEEINGKRITLKEFESFISRSIIVETNRIYKILNKEKEAIFLQHIDVILDVVSGLSGHVFRGYYKMFMNLRTIYIVSRILREISEPERLLAFGPQLSLIDNFSKMLIRKNGDMLDVQPNEFLKITSKFFVFENKGQLMFLGHEHDATNNANNKAFSVTTFQCPGNLYTMRFIDSILSFLQEFDITITGEVKYSTGRFVKIMNKNDIHLTFKRRPKVEVKSDNMD